MGDMKFAKNVGWIREALTSTAWKSGSVEREAEVRNGKWRGGYDQYKRTSSRRRRGGGGEKNRKGDLYRGWNRVGEN